MIHINLVTEDDLSTAILKVILKQVGKPYTVHRRFPNPDRTGASGGFGYIKKRINDFNKAARSMPFLVLTDLDQNECAPGLVKEWLTQPCHPNLIFRVAVRETEAWLMADREAFSLFLGISTRLIPQDIDQSVIDPKRLLFDLARKSVKKRIKDAILPRPKSFARVGPDYNGTLSEFLFKQWRLNRAVCHSDSLNRASNALKRFKLKA
jgi:hypothetical protein